MTPTRRAVIEAALAAAWPLRAAADETVTVRVASEGARRPISPYVYGSNEVGTLDGGPPSADLDRKAGVAARRFGGNLTTSYNWTTNVSNAGKDYRHANGALLGPTLGLPQGEAGRPAAVIEAMHRSSLGMGAISLVTLPLAGYVAADDAGPVAPGEAAPSARFVPVRWTSRAGPGDPIDPSVADIQQLLRRLVATFGPADGPTGIRAYALDNEPDLWAETHPRIVRHPVRIAELVARSLKAARAIKAVDPSALVFGPASWGATGMASLQDAPDWPAYRRRGSFLAVYLDAFRKASEADGRRLLDALDVHWYPFSTRGPLFRTEDAGLAAALLDAPRSLDEPGFREDSWVPSALPVSDEGGLALPLLPSLHRLTAQHFPGTRLAVTEFNYGGAGLLASGLALADALGRLGRDEVFLAAHWGSLAGWLAQAYRLYRDYDGHGARFGGESLEVRVSQPARLGAYAAMARDTLHVVVINKAAEALTVVIVLDAPITDGRVAAFGFDADRPATGPVAPDATLSGRSLRCRLPARSARLYAVASGRLDASP